MSGTSFKELQKRHMRRVQGFYRRQYRALEAAKKRVPYIPRRKKNIFFYMKSLHIFVKFNLQKIF